MAPWRGKPIGFLVAPQRLRMRSALPSFNKLGRPGGSPSPDSAARSRSLELRQQTNEPPSAVDWVASGFLFVAKLVLISGQRYLRVTVTFGTHNFSLDTQSPSRCHAGPAVSALIGRALCVSVAPRLQRPLPISGIERPAFDHWVAPFVLIPIAYKD
jgi:hypothetical protein